MYKEKSTVLLLFFEFLAGNWLEFGDKNGKLVIFTVLLKYCVSLGKNKHGQVDVGFKAMASFFVRRISFLGAGSTFTLLYAAFWLANLVVRQALPAKKCLPMA